MTEVDNQEVVADAAPVAEGQDQTNTLLGGDATPTETVVADTPAADTSDWMASLPDDIKSAKSMQSIKKKKTR